MLLVVRYTLVQHWFESTMKDKKSMLPTAPPPFSSASCWKLEVSQRQEKWLCWKRIDHSECFVSEPKNKVPITQSLTHFKEFHSSRKYLSSLIRSPTVVMIWASQESTHFHINSNLFGPLWRKKSVFFGSTISATTSHVMMIWASPRVHPFPYNFKLICSSLEEEDFF